MRIGTPEGDTGREPVEIPEDAAHVVATDRFKASAPDGHDEERLKYRAGDELPFDAGIGSVEQHPRTLAVFNEEGELVAGARGVSEEELDAVRDRWQRGDGFDPAEYADCEGE